MSVKVLSLPSVLLVAVIVSSAYLVNLQYQERKLFTELELLRDKATDLKIEQNRLDVEKAKLSSNVQVRELAPEQGMVDAEPGRTIYIELN